jgi:choice-of-anchor B domain-containing protein
MKKFFTLVFVVVIVNTFSTTIYSHAEHDKPRYVADDGEDTGRCEKARSPCKTIRYAAQHANKGDHIKIASGSYQIDDTDTLFYLLSQTLPTKANYSTKDNFSKPDISNLTRLVGVPMEYVQQLSDKGFTVIVDQKGQNSEQQVILQSKLDIHSRLQKAQAETLCLSGSAGDYPCSNLDLLAHVPLASFSTNPAEANDIWGHFDLNDFKEYALIGLRNGIGIVEVTNPEEPRVVVTIASESTIWRDIKVYQFFDPSAHRWKSYAYVTADNASVGVLVIDLNELPTTASVASTLVSDLSAHNVYLSNVDYSTGVSMTGMSPYLHIAGSNVNGGAFNTYHLTNPTSPTSAYKPLGSSRSAYSHDVSSMVIKDARKDTQCVNGTEHCEIFFDFNENNFQLWDKTENTSPQRLSTTTYTNAEYVHSGWFTEDKLVVIVHDELDEQNVGLNTTVRFFEMNDLTEPTSIGTWTGPTRAIDHNGFVRGNRYYMSNYERGMTVLDITEPSNPTEVGFFDTYPLNDSASFNGAWGVYPFLPSGNILVSDINSGLYILRDNTLTSTSGSFSFNANNYDVIEGESATISVNRLNGSQGNVQVSWELATGAADENDFTLNTGILEWLDGESDTKTIEVYTLVDEENEPEEKLFIRLFDPKNGSTLSQPNISTIAITSSGINSAPVVSAGEDIEAETGSLVSLAATASDVDGDLLVFQWSQVSGESISINNDDTLTPSFSPIVTGSYQFEITASDPAGNNTSDSVIVNIVDSNSVPIVNAGNDSEFPVGSQVSLIATASDQDGDTLTYQWSQTSGETVLLTNADSLEANFIATNDGNYRFTFTATDPDNASDSDSIEVRVMVINSAPNVAAGNNQTVTEGQEVNLSATASDQDDDTLTYQWLQTSGETVSLSHTDSLQTSFIASNEGDYSFTFTATDPNNASASDSIDIKVAGINHAPTVNAGSDQTVLEGQLVSLSATAFDEDDDTLSYRWQQNSGTVISLSSINTLQTSFTASNEGNYNFSISVTDEEGLSATANVDIIVKKAEAEVVESSGGGSLGIGGIVLLLVILRRRFI